MIKICCGHRRHDPADYCAVGVTAMNKISYRIKITSRGLFIPQYKRRWIWKCWYTQITLTEKYKVSFLTEQDATDFIERRLAEDIALQEKLEKYPDRIIRYIPTSKLLKYKQPPSRV